MDEKDRRFKFNTFIRDFKEIIVESTRKCVANLQHSFLFEESGRGLSGQSPKFLQPSSCFPWFPGGLSEHNSFRHPSEIITYLACKRVPPSEIIEFLLRDGIE